MARSPAKKRTKASFSESPLARPETPVHRLASTLQNYLYLPDPAPLYATVGALVGNSLLGYPVWLMLIGPGSCGKTSLLKALTGLSGVVECGSLSGEAALLSGVKKKDIVAGAKGGLLRNLITNVSGESRGALVMLDFARTVLNNDPKEVKKNMGSIGMLYDGHWTRDVGTDGGKTLEWSGRVGFLAGTTGVIDEHATINAQMGERCVYYRYRDSDGWAETNRMLGNADPKATSTGIQHAVEEFAAEINFNWDDQEPPRALTNTEKEQIIALAQFSAKARGAVVRDFRNDRGIVDVPQAEMPPRLAGELAQFLRGMEKSGVSSEESWVVLRKVALDSLPAVRIGAIRSVQAGKCGASDVAEALRVSRTAAQRTLEDLEAHGIVKRTDNAHWSMTTWSEERFVAGWGALESV